MAVEPGSPVLQLKRSGVVSWALQIFQALADMHHSSRNSGQIIVNPRKWSYKMLMLSSRAKYAVRACTMLAQRAGDGSWVQAGEIAEQETIPRKFLEAILSQLREHGVIESRRGWHGGHRLARQPEAVSVADIMRIVDGPLALTPCASVTRFRPCVDCVDIEACRLQPVMREARNAVAAVLEAQSLKMLSEDDGKKPRIAAKAEIRPPAKTTRPLTKKAKVA